MSSMANVGDEGHQIPINNFAMLHKDLKAPGDLMNGKQSEAMRNLQTLRQKPKFAA
jgi:serine/threonine protein kinase